MLLLIAAVDICCVRPLCCIVVGPVAAGASSTACLLPLSGMTNSADDSSAAFALLQQAG